MAPDLVVEILSPTDRPAEVQRKLDEYFASGVRLAWVVDPAERVVHVHERHRAPRRFIAGEVLLGGGVLPGLALAVDEVFE